MNTIAQSTRKAFTLLEMVAVLVLILVLAGIAVPTYQAVIGKTRDNAAELSAKSFAKSIDAYAATQQVAPDSLDPALLATGGTLALELPAGATSSVNAGVVTVCLDAGVETRCADITLSNLVGGSSTVGDATSNGGGGSWTNATISGTITLDSLPKAEAPAILVGDLDGDTIYWPMCANGDNPASAGSNGWCGDPGQGGVVFTQADLAGVYTITVTQALGARTYKVLGLSPAPPGSPAFFHAGYTGEIVVTSGGTYTDQDINLNDGYDSGGT